MTALHEASPLPDVLELDISRRLWFPATQEFEPDIVRTVLEDARKEPIKLQGGKEFVFGTKTLAAEALHESVDIETAVFAAAHIGIREGVVQEVAEQVMPAAQNIARLIVAKTRDVERQPGNKRVQRRIKHNPALRTVLAAKVLATNVHDGEKRLNGVAYEIHPNAVDTIARDSTKVVFRHDSEAQAQLRVNSWIHDMWEHAYPKHAGSPLASPRLIGSPLVVFEMLKMLDMAQLDALRVARYQLLMTHTVHMGAIVALREASGSPLDPKGLEYEKIKDAEYKAAISVIAQYPGAAIPKRADIKHNDEFDPKFAPIAPENSEAYAKWLAKQNVYRWSADHLDGTARQWPVAASNYATAMQIIASMQKKHLLKPRRDKHGLRLHEITPSSLLLDKETVAL